MKQTAFCRAELVAVLLNVRKDTPCVLTLEKGQILPSGPLTMGGRSLQRELRGWVEQQTGMVLGHTEQLYTFADTQVADKSRLVRISYMAMISSNIDQTPAERSLYDYFPWEDRRNPEAHLLLQHIVGLLQEWVGMSADKQQRCARLFGLDPYAWNDELALDRYELLWEAGLVQEARAFQGHISLGLPMQADYRRVLATALSRVRAKIRYTSVVFDLLPETFTLLQLQQAMEALAGCWMHKQNFRRLVLQQKLVEETGAFDTPQQGRPAKLFRFRPQMGQNCYLAGAKLPLTPLS
ncbi:membrane protein [Acetobacter aceti 1023]|nr:membrane protein [Acetobacter aceti 1023]